MNNLVPEIVKSMVYRRYPLLSISKDKHWFQGTLLLGNTQMEKNTVFVQN